MKYRKSLITFTWLITYTTVSACSKSSTVSSNRSCVVDSLLSESFSIKGASPLSSLPTVTVHKKIFITPKTRPNILKKSKPEQFLRRSFNAFNIFPNPIDKQIKREITIPSKTVVLRQQVSECLKCILKKNPHKVYEDKEEFFLVMTEELYKKNKDTFASLSAAQKRAFFCAFREAVTNIVDSGRISVEKIIAFDTAAKALAANTSATAALAAKQQES